MKIKSSYKNAPKFISSSLRSEEQVMSTWQNVGPPLVSICCATFNQDKFLSDALHSFLDQITTFPFEIIVRDDASTDNTKEILSIYEKKYPNIIRKVIESENQYRLGIWPTKVWPALVKGQFIAFCEGDDFWVCSDKLQKQIELLREYPESVMSVAMTDVFKQTENSLDYESTFAGNYSNLQYLKEVNSTYFHTSTFVIKTDIFAEVISKYFQGSAFLGDTALRYILVSYGPFVFLPKVVSVYRKTGHGVWTSLDREKQLDWEINVTKFLFSVMSGEARIIQGIRIYNLSLGYLKFYIKNKRFKEMLPILKSLIYPGLICKILAFKIKLYN